MSSQALAQLLLQRNVASRATVVLIPSFFSDEDIARVFDIRDEHHRRLGPPRLARRGWQTTYVSAGGLFRARSPDLHARLRSLRHRIDLSPFISNDAAAPAEATADGSCSGSGALLDGLEVRCIEVHEGGPGGSLNDPRHFDNGSVVTADVLLDDGFEGGAFTTLDGDGAAERHAFARGDALVFPSYKYHSVAPVTAGRRATLVVEFWRGDENRCNHRCDLQRAPGDGAAARPCPDAAGSGGCPDLVTVSFADPGTFGCGFAFGCASDPAEADPVKIQDGRPVAAVVAEVRPGTQAGDHPGLVPGLVLTHVAGTAVRGLGFADLDAVLAEAVLGEARPVEMRLARPTVNFTQPG